MDVTAYELNAELDMRYGYDNSFERMQQAEEAAEEAMQDFGQVKDLICNEWIDSDILAAHVKAIYTAVENGNAESIVIMAKSLRNSIFDAAVNREVKS